MWMREALVATVAIVCLGAAPRISNSPPTADADVPLSDGRTLHVLDLPLGQLDGFVLDGARFDASGGRVALLARFLNGAIDGDWHRAAPTQAFVLDVERRTLTALTTDGLATAVRWTSSSSLAVTDGGLSHTFDVGPPARATAAHFRVDAVGASTTGAVVSPSSEFRLQLLKADSGVYAVGEVGAVRLRAIAVAPRGRYALLGAYVVWIDGSRYHGAPLSRIGADDVQPLSFAGTGYGDELTQVFPLGHLAYQGAYRNGVAYFAFTYGLRRIVAATTDFETYAYPSLPAQPDFTIGDGLGAGADGVLYFADPLNDVVQTWHNGKYVESSMSFPSGVSDMSRLDAAMSQLTSGGSVWPALEPDADALDAAMLEWRIYPIGDATGPRWIASYLGRAYVAGADLRFREIGEPAFPFVVLGRTDDGRLWAAAPVARSMRGATIVRSSSSIWFSRDGFRWSGMTTVAGDAGAVGLSGSAVWVAMSAPEPDGAGVEVERMGSSDAGPAPTGALYGGEDMFFADVAGGYYLVCGGEPGTRPDDTFGALVALRLDDSALFDLNSQHRNAYVSERLASSDTTSSNFSAVAQPSADTLAHLGGPLLPTLVAPSPGSFDCCRTLTPDSLARFELEFAWHPYPLARVSVAPSGDDAIVTRTLERGPLAIDGQVERWHRDAAGSWHLIAVLRRFKV